MQDIYLRKVEDGKGTRLRRSSPIKRARRLAAERLQALRSWIYAFFLIQLLNGVQYGLLLFLVASGLTLIFGIMGIINLAHGSFYMIGAYMAFSLSSLTGNLCVAIALGVVLSVVLGIVARVGAASPSVQARSLEQVLLTYGLILIFEELRSMIVGNDVHGVAVPRRSSTASIPLTDTLSYPVYRLFMSAVCIVLAGGLYVLIHRTRLGMMIRAGASNREMVQALGLNINLVYRARVRAGRRAGGVRRHDRGAGLVGVSRHGQRRC